MNAITKRKFKYIDKGSVVNFRFMFEMLNDKYRYIIYHNDVQLFVTENEFDEYFEVLEGNYGKSIKCDPNK